MKKGSISKVGISITTALLLSACGGGSGSSSPTVTDEIKVVDGYVMGATVTDKNGKAVGTTDANGAVKGDVSTLAYPLHAKGGFIDLNSNGVFDTGVDTKMPDNVEFLTNKSSGKVISPLTTLLASGVNADDLAKLAGVSVSDLYTDPMLSTNVNNLVKANQIAYGVIVGNGVDTFKSLVGGSGIGSTATLADIAKSAAPASSNFIDLVDGLDSSYSTLTLEKLVGPLKVIIAPSALATTTDSNITVVDGYVIGATVSDGTISAITSTVGIATAAFDTTKVITAKGGTIDANNNGLADADELSAPDMSAPIGKSVISPITQLIVGGATEAKLASLLSVSASDLYTDPLATNNVVLAKAMQIAYAVSKSGKEASFATSVNESNVTTTTSTSTGSAVDKSTSNDLNLPNISYPSLRVGISSASAGSITAFADLAKALFAAGSTEANFIDAVLALTSSEAKSVETDILADKTVLASALADNATAASDTAASSDTNTTSSTDTNTTSSDATKSTTPTTNTASSGALPSFGYSLP